MVRYRPGVAEVMKSCEAVSRETVDTYRVVSGIDDAAGTIQQREEFGVGASNLEHGLLHTMAVALTQLGHPPEATPSFRVDGADIVGEQELHQLTVHGT